MLFPARLVGLGGGTILLLLGAAVTTLNTAERNNAIPLPRMDERPQLLRFGMYVTPDPAQNPIDPPERFTGYHAALDLEIIAGEEAQAVPVKAVCDGPVVRSSSVEGYGGLVIQACEMNNEPVTVLYGHLSRENMAERNVRLARGQHVGVLASERTSDSGHNRKHLHLGIHRGTAIDVRGYVQSEAELAEFIDPKAALGI